MNLQGTIVKNFQLQTGAIIENTEVSMSNKFDKLNEESALNILQSGEFKLDELDAFYERWSWDNCNFGESVIFFTSDVAEKDDDTLIDLVKKTSLPSGDCVFAVTKVDEYSHVNFNFGYVGSDPVWAEFIGQWAGDNVRLEEASAKSFSRVHSPLNNDTESPVKNLTDDCLVVFLETN
jgi:hypothetical protein